MAASQGVELIMTADSGDLLEELVVATVAGDASAWQRLWSALEPTLLRMVAQPRFLGPLGQREDDRRNVVVEVVARLRADDFRRLRLYLAARRENPALDLLTWLRVVTKRVGIDYLRGHPDYLDRRRHRDRAAGADPGEWVAVEPLPSGSRLRGDRPPYTNRGTAAQLLRYAAGAIPDVQRRALELWVQGDDHLAIARTLALADAHEAGRLVRAAIERLRRRFRIDREGGDR